MLEVLPDEKERIEKMERMHRREGQSNDFMDILAPLQQKVLKRKADLKSKLLEWQNNFYAEFLKEPTVQDFQDNNEHCMLTTYWSCKNLLKNWKIFL